MLNKVSTDLKAHLPLELVDALLTSYSEIRQNFLLGNHEPSELNGGKFCEACYRIIEYETNNGNYTPLGTEIRDLIGHFRRLEQIPAANALDSYRIHIPRVLTIMYSTRNQRGVGHIGGDVNPNSADSALLMSCADWVLAELFRVYYQCPLSDAQDIVNALVQRPLALVHDLGNVKRVLLPSLRHRDQTLLLLASVHPQAATVDQLITWIEPSGKSQYVSKVLRVLHNARLIELSSSGQCVITPIGLKYIDSQYPIWVAKLNGKE